MKKLFFYLFVNWFACNGMISVPTEELELAIKSNDPDCLKKLFDEYLFIDPKHRFQEDEFQGLTLLQAAFQKKCFESVYFLLDQDTINVEYNDLVPIENLYEQTLRKKSLSEALQLDPRDQIEGLNQIKKEAKIIESIYNLAEIKFDEGEEE